MAKFTLEKHAAVSVVSASLVCGPVSPRQRNKVPPQRMRTMSTTLKVLFHIIINQLPQRSIGTRKNDDQRFPHFQPSEVAWPALMAKFPLEKHAAVSVVAAALVCWPVPPRQRNKMPPQRMRTMSTTFKVLFHIIINQLPQRSIGTRKNDGQRFAHFQPILDTNIGRGADE